MVNVSLFGRFREKAGNVEHVECEGGSIPTVKSVLKELVKKHPKLKDELFDKDSGDLQHGVQITLDGRNVRLMLDGLDSHLEGAGETIDIHPATAEDEEAKE